MDRAGRGMTMPTPSITATATHHTTVPRDDESTDSALHIGQNVAMRAKAIRKLVDETSALRAADGRREGPDTLASGGECRRAVTTRVPVTVRARPTLTEEDRHVSLPALRSAGCESPTTPPSTPPTSS